MASRGQARPTLRDVAERAGVSVSTASLVFSGKGPVAEATGERVRAAATELGFAGPNPLASSLRHGRAGVIGVLVDARLQMAFRDPFAIAVLDGLAQELETIPTGMLLLGQPSGEPESTVPRLAGLALDAVVFSLCGPGDHPAVQHLAARGIPMFSTGVPDDRRITQVRVDERGAAAEIARYVRALGHRRVATVAMPMLPTSVAGPVPDSEVTSRSASVPSVGRLLGFRDVFPRGAALQTQDGSSVEGGIIAGRALLDVPDPQRPTAIVTQSDVIAAGVGHRRGRAGPPGPRRPLGHRLRRRGPAVAASPPHDDGPAGPREGPDPRHSRASHARRGAATERHAADHAAGGDDDRTATRTLTPPHGIRRAGPAGQEDTPRTWKSSPTLAAFLPWGSSERYHHAGCRRRVYAAPAPAPNPASRISWGPRPPVASPTEDSHSGLVRTIGNRVGIKPSGVQIPHPPPSATGLVALSVTGPVVVSRRVDAVDAGGVSAVGALGGSG